METSTGGGRRALALLGACGTVGLLVAATVAAVYAMTSAAGWLGDLTASAGGAAEVGITAAAVVSALAAFGGAALRWGVDSRDGVDSAEWARRREWGA